MSRLERWIVWIGSVVVTLTGVAYLWMKYLLSTDDPLAVVNHPWQPAILKLHLLSAPLLVFALGLIAVRHVVWHWLARTPQARRSGVTAAVAILPMVATGYLIQAVTHAGWLRAIAWAHIGTGVVYAAGFVVHQVVAGPTARARHRPPGPGTAAGLPTAPADAGAAGVGGPLARRLLAGPVRRRVPSAHRTDRR